MICLSTLELLLCFPFGSECIHSFCKVQAHVAEEQEDSPQILLAVSDKAKFWARLYTRLWHSCVYE